MAKKSKKQEPVREPTPSPSASDSESDYSSDDTIEDEDGAELTPAMDAAILQTLTRIRNKKDVYGGENIMATALAAAQEQADKRGLKRPAAKKEDKPFLLKDLHRANLLAGVTHDSDEEEEEPLTNVEAERRARKDAVSAFNALADESDEEDGFLVKRDKDEEEVADDDAAYRAFLLEMGGGEDQVRRALGMADAPVTDYREDVESEGEDQEKKEEKSKKAKKEKISAAEKEERKKARQAKRVQADEDFLMDYILNRGWINKEDQAAPTYEDIVGHESDDSGSESDSGEQEKQHPWGKLEEEDEFDERADEFEHQYNFRYEEPGSGAILTHPRNIDSLVRREDDKRKTKREERAERKAAEKAAKEEETRRLKGAKRREMEGMLESLKKELGDGVDWEGVERIMDGDFDEDEWERVVTAMLQAKADREDGVEDDDNEKPSWDNDDLGDYPDEGADDGWIEPTRWEEAEEEVDGDEAPFNMDADYIGLEEQPKQKKSKKDKKKSKSEKRAEAQAAANAELSFSERTEKLKNVATELNALHGEDTIGELRTRFKYTKSAPVSFGLTPAEILMATDAELNEVMSVKHLAPYRRGLGIAGRGLGSRVRQLKATVSQRKWGDEMPTDNKKGKKAPPGPGGSNATPLGEGRPGKRLGKKERLKKKNAEPEAVESQPVSGKRKREEEPAETPSAPDPVAEGEGKKKRRKKKKTAAA